MLALELRLVVPLISGLLMGKEATALINAVTLLRQAVLTLPWLVEDAAVVPVLQRVVVVG